MPRPWEEEVQDFPNLRAGQVYSLRVVDIRKQRQPAGICVRLEHIDPNQAGRLHEQTLPVPIRPAGLAASFFRACGIEPRVGKTIAPQKTLNALVGVSFSRVPEHSEMTITAFTRITGENHESSPEQHAAVSQPAHSAGPAAQTPPAVVR